METKWKLLVYSDTGFVLHQVTLPKMTLEKAQEEARKIMDQKHGESYNLTKVK